MQNWLGAILKMNKVTDNYTYDASADEIWGIKADETFYDGTGKQRTDCHVRANGYTSEDGNIYTMFVDSNPALADNMAWTEWEFLSQFRREADGSISIAE